MAVMELKIYNPQENGFLQKIEWNFDELKAQIANASQDYENLVYSDDNIKSAKSDRAKLNKLVDALKGKRTEIRKQLLKPDEQFGMEVQELTGIVQKAISNIDQQVKNFEQRQRDEKTAKVREFYEENINDLAAYLPFERVFRPEFANASTTMKFIKEEITGLIQKVAEGLAIINEVESPYAGDMKKVFLDTYDIGHAMAERNRLEDAERQRREYQSQQEKLKAEREAQAKAQAEAVMAAGRTEKRELVEPATPKIETVEEPLNIIDFRVKATSAQLRALKTFLVENRIQFGPVPKEGK